jgi:hypothetical protein
MGKEALRESGDDKDSAPHIAGRRALGVERGSATRSSFPRQDAFGIGGDVLKFGRAAAHRAALRVLNGLYARSHRGLLDWRSFH